MRYANEGRHLLPQGSTTGLPHKYFLPQGSTTRLLPQLGQYLLHVCVTTWHVYTYHTCQSSTTTVLVVTDSCGIKNYHTIFLEGTCTWYKIFLKYHTGVPHSKITHQYHTSIPQYDTSVPHSNKATQEYHTAKLHSTYHIEIIPHSSTTQHYHAAVPHSSITQHYHTAVPHITTQEYHSAVPHSNTT